MQRQSINRHILFHCVICMAVVTGGCDRSADPNQSSTATNINPNTAQTITAAQCNSDPRVVAGLMPLVVCQGGWIFFNETFHGNGRTCATCHPVANNYTIDAKFISALPSDDKLFYGFQPRLRYSFRDDQDFDTGEPLETDAIRSKFALVKLHIDGFEDVQYKFVSRSVPHLLSMATSIDRDPTDNTGSDIVERIGWGGDGSPGDGSLRSFLDAAIEQHFTQDNNRLPPISFRLATEAEKDQMLAFMLALGRTADIDLSNVTMSDNEAAIGQSEFMDPLGGRCNHCHSNAGANFAITGLNRNFNTGTVHRPTVGVPQPDGSFLYDGGFGGKGLYEPNFTAVSDQPDAFGDGTFNTPSLIEAIDTGPFFHNHSSGNSFVSTDGIERAVGFYGSTTFKNSPSALALDSFFGAGIGLTPASVAQIARFLRVLNASFNLAIAIQRLDAAHDLNVRFQDMHVDIQKGLLMLADAEIEDAFLVLSFATSDGGNPLHPGQQILLQNARGLVTEALEASTSALRIDKILAVLGAVEVAKAALGTGMDFELGTGNLMF